MNNGESIKKYNDLLIGYLNQLVNSIDNNTANDTFFTDIAAKLKNHLVMYNMDIAEQGVKTMMVNAFKQYSSILKKHFDSSNIHRINLPPEDTNLTNEMNTVTANLSNAVTNMNKIPEYLVLIDTVKSTLKGYFSQNYESYKDLEFEIEQILNEVIVGAFTTFTTTKIDDFTRMILPDLYALADSITYDSVNSSMDEDGNVNEERDQFIRDTMDIDIEESFENGRVVLKVYDSDGKTQVYYSTEAMEKLTSYNQLFESSRPGKKADTSNWAYDVSLNPTLANNNTVESNTNMAFETVEQAPQQDLVEQNVSTPVDMNTTNDLSTLNAPTNDSNEALIKDFLANQNTNTSNDDFSNLTNAVNQPNNNNDFNELTNVLNNDVSNTTTSYNNNNNDEFNNLDSAVNNQVDTFTNLDSPSSIVNFFNNDMTSNSNYNDGVVFGDLTAPTQNNNDTNIIVNGKDNNSLNNNSELDEDLTQVRHMMGIDNNSSSFGGSFSFLPEYNNPNEERDAFIKKTTGIEIDEDTDHKGELYLKVVEPTGREQIYTGKEAVNMIKNFNKAFLDANPGKKVDTTLIDNFKQE